MTESEQQALKQEVDSLSSKTDKNRDDLEEIKKQVADSYSFLRARDPLGNSYIFSKIITGTTDATAGTESTHAHTLGVTPPFVFITSKSNGVVYLTSKSQSDIKVKGSASSLNFTAYLLA